MYAIIRSGGKQYRVQENRTVRLELLDAEVGSAVELNDVSLLGGDGATHVGTPVVEGARVLGKVVSHGRTRRIVVFKYKPKKGYHRRRGHRQNFHEVLVEQILAPGQEPRERPSRRPESDRTADETVQVETPVTAAETPAAAPTAAE